MTSVSTGPARAQASNPTLGISCVLFAMIFFVAQDVMMKSLLETYPIWVLLFIRSFVTVLVLVPLILYLGRPHRILSPLWPLHVLRGALFVLGFSLFYAAFPFMGLAEVTTIFFSAPLIVAVFAALWLKEHIGPHRIGALVVGFIGVVIAVNPTGGNFTWVSILPLTCAVAYALMQILARQIGDRETSLTVGLNSLGTAGILILPAGWLLNQVVSIPAEFTHLQFTFPLDRVEDYPLLLLLAVLGMIAWVVLSRAYQVASASLVAPFDYAYLPIATIVGYLLFDEVPSTHTLVGMVLIILSGLYLGYRELKATASSDEPALVAESTYAPGNPLPPQSSEEDLSLDQRTDDR